MTTTLVNTTLETLNSFLNLPFLKEFLIVLLALVVFFFLIK
jgi:hypothetical protein